MITKWGLRRYKWNLTIFCIRCSRRLLLRWSPLQIKGRFRNSSKEFHTTFPPPGVLQRRARRSSRQEVTSLPNKLFLEDSTLVSLISLSLYQIAMQKLGSFYQGCIFCTPKCFVTSKRPIETFRVRQRRLSQVGTGELKYLKQTMWIGKLKQSSSGQNSSLD